MTLAELLSARGVQRALVVDDACDEVPRAVDLTAGAGDWATFAADLTPEHRDLLDKASTETIALTFDQRAADDRYVAAVWSVRDQLDGLAETLFEGYEAQRAADLEYVELAREQLTALGLDASTCGREFEDRAQDVDLIVIDLYFGGGQNEAAFQESRRRLTEAVHRRRDRPPLVLLMSRSERIYERRDEFRDTVGLVDSGFRIILKPDLSAAGRLDRQLERLAENRPDTLKLAGFFNALEDGIDDAASRTLRVMRRLKLSDVGQIQQLLLEVEGEPVGSYLVDIFDRVLQHEIERDSAIIDAALAINDLTSSKHPPPFVTGSPQLQEVVERTLTQNLERLRLPGAADASVGFGDVLRPGAAVGGATVPCAVLEADEVLVVLTPACDLQRGVAPRVLLAGGKIKEIGALQWSYAQDTRTPAILIEEELRSIKWNLKDMPDIPFHLDALLADAPLVGGLSPMLGDQHLRTLTVRGFPTITWPGLLDDLNRLAFPYRWVVRFLCLDKAEAEKELAKRRRQWFAKRKSVLTLLRETAFQQESPLVDSDAANKAADADEAMQALGGDAVGFGYVTATVSVWNADGAIADERLRAVERAISSRGFVSTPETLNAVEAWLSSIPGHLYANVRTPIVSTLNLAHLLPLSAVWAGPDENTHLDGPPLLITRTEGATPFRLVTHVGDVGHTLIVGPTGSGKSVLLATLVLQFRKYAQAQVTVFDKGGSIRAAMLGLGGAYHDLGLDAHDLAFQPLRQINDAATRAWAAEWIQGLVAREGVPLTPEVKDAVWSALTSLASAPPEERTLTGLCILLQSNALRQTLAPYTLKGPFGHLLDAETEGLGLGELQAFEMEDLMRSPALTAAVLSYLFHRLDAGFDGRPALLVLDEAWVFLDDPVFSARIREWLKTLRKKNVSVVFATQSLADIQRSTIAPAIVESCPSRIFLPSPQALEPQLRPIYEGFGLNSRQIDLIARAQPKRDYYLQSALGNRLFELGLGPIALAFVGASSPADHAAMDAVLRTVEGRFAAAWLKSKGLDWAANLLTRQDLAQHARPETRS